MFTYCTNDNHRSQSGPDCGSDQQKKMQGIVKHINDINYIITHN